MSLTDTPPNPPRHSMGRPKSKPTPEPIEPEDESQDVEEAGEPAGHAEGNGLVSKADACRAALAEGIGTTEEAVAFVKSRFGLDIKPSDFSVYKSKEKKKGGAAPEPGRRGRKPKGAPGQGAASHLAPAPPPPRPSGDSELLSAMEAMKPLVASLGKEQVKRSWTCWGDRKMWQGNC